MKIAQVNNYYYLRGGSERVLYDDRDALIAAGHEVRPFAPQDERNEPAVSSSFFPIVAGYERLGPVGTLKAAGAAIYSPGVGSAFAAFLDDFKPDVIHCHNIYGRLTTSVLDQAREHRIPAVLTVHDLKLVCPSYLGLRQGQACMLCKDGSYWRCARYKCHKDSTAGSLLYSIEGYFNRLRGKYDTVARFLCPSRFMQQSLIGAGIRAERAVYHPNALAPEQYEPCFEPGKYVLYTGRLSPEKGIMTLLHAVECTGIPLRIAGEGPLDAALRARIAERRLPVQMEGYCGGQKLAELYRRAAFTVVPSEWYENASMSALESFAYGKPVLASQIGGNPELVIDGLSGMLFAPANVDELTRAMGSMWRDRDELAGMGRRARSLIDEKFARQKRLIDMIAIYRDACGQQPLDQ